MKYLIIYSEIRGYDDDGRNIWENAMDELYTKETAFKKLVEIFTEDCLDYDRIIAIPETPDEFVKEDNDLEEHGFKWVPNFNEVSFLKEAIISAKKIKAERLAEAQRKKEIEEQQAAKNREARERQEFERLKAKFS
jgi:hypothetical protein